MIDLNIFSEIEKKEIRSNWKEFRDILKNNNIDNLYHITDQSNIKSVKTYGGLYSWSHCERNGILINNPGGNKLSRHLDTKKILIDFVRLWLNTNQPMIHIAKQDGRIKDPVILQINPIIIFLSTTMFSSINATDNNAEIGNSINDFHEIKFDVLKKDRWEGNLEKKIFQAEILVKNNIPMKFIKNLKNLN